MPQNDLHNILTELKFLVKTQSQRSRGNIYVGQQYKYLSRLKLNSEKTQFIWLDSRQQLSKVGVDHVHLGNYAAHHSPQSAISGFIFAANSQ